MGGFLILLLVLLIILIYLCGVSYQKKKKKKSCLFARNKCLTNEFSVCEKFGGEQISKMGNCGSRSFSWSILVFLVNKVLDLIGMDVGTFFISCHFKICEEGFI